MTRRLRASSRDWHRCAHGFLNREGRVGPPILSGVVAYAEGPVNAMPTMTSKSSLRLGPWFKLYRGDQRIFQCCPLNTRSDGTFADGMNGLRVASTKGVR